MTCTCPEVHLNAGDRTSVSRNWNPDCPEHGTSSVWWQSPERTEAWAYQARMLKRLQRLARFRRQTGWKSKAPV